MTIKITNYAYSYRATSNGAPILTVQITEVTLPNGYLERTVCEIEQIKQHGSTSEQSLEAIKLIFDKILEDYGEYPYIPSTLEDNEKKVLDPLIKSGFITKRQLLDPELESYSHDLKQTATRNSIAGLTTKQKQVNLNQSGFLPKERAIEKRMPRSYSKERSEQILRHVSTQLYNYCKSRDLKPIEVQMMYLGTSLVIATNSAAVTKALYAELNPKRLKRVLTTAFAKHDGIERKISARFASKIASRIYGDYAFKHRRDQVIKDVLQNAQMLEIDTNNLEGFDYQPGVIYFVTGCDVTHAEMHLLKILKHFRVILDDAYGETVIYGKKRPCFTCHSALEATHQEGLEFSYNPRRGPLFLEEFRNQSESNASNTIEALTYQRPVYETKYCERYGYCTLSDSEPEEEEEIPGLSSATQKLSVS